MYTRPQKAVPSSRPPEYITSEQRARYAELAGNYRAVAGRTTGAVAAVNYDKAAHNYELLRNHELVHQMKLFADAVRPKVRTSPDKIPVHVLDNTSVAASVISIGILGALTFLYNGITGNAIGGMEKETSEWIGVVLLLIAIGFGAFYIARKANKRKK